MKRRAVLAGGALAALAAGPALRAARAPADGGAIDPAPAGAVVPLGPLPQLHDGAALWSPAAMRGRAWVLHAWASWCAPCRSEHPLWVAAVRDTGLALVGLNTQDDPHAAREWLLKLGDPYRTVLLDRDGRAAAALGLRGVPASFLIDGDGVLRLRHVGPMTRAAWAGEALPLLRGLRA